MGNFYHPNAKPGSLSGVAEVRGGSSNIRLQTYELEFTAAQLNTADIIYLDKFNADTRILGGWIEFDELDAHATTPLLEIDCGWDDGTTDDPDGFLNSGVIAGGGPANVVLTTGVGTAVSTFIPAADWDFKLTVIAAAATAAAGTIKVSVLLADGSSSNEDVVQ